MIVDDSAQVTPLVGDFGLIGYRHEGKWLDRAAERLIEFGTDSKFNHAFVYVGNGQIVEAVRHVKVSPASSYKDITWSTGRLGPDHTPTQVQRQAVARAAMSFVGESYNIVDILAIALAQARMGHLVEGDEWWVKRLSDDHMQICSQLVVNAYRLASIDLAPGTLSGLVSPGDLARLFRI